MKICNSFSWLSFGSHFRSERQNTVEQSGIRWRSLSGVAGSGNEPERKTSLPRTVSAWLFTD